MQPESFHNILSSDFLLGRGEHTSHPCGVHILMPEAAPGLSSHWNLYPGEFSFHRMLKQLPQKESLIQPQKALKSMCIFQGSWRMWVALVVTVHSAYLALSVACSRHFGMFSLYSHKDLTGAGGICLFL